MTGYLFAGQGSQYVGMGRDLYEAFPESKTVFDRADKALGFPLSKLCFSGPQEELTLTHNCQPAVLTMGIAAWEAFKVRARDAVSDNNYAAGLSLGEYSALVASQALTFEDAVYLTRKRGEFMEEEALKFPGKMASILGLDLEVIKDICRKTQTEIANLNCPGQVVISGRIKDIEDARAMALSKDAARVVILEVSGAFHSSFMKEASSKLAKELGKVRISMPKVPVVSNATARIVTCVDEIKANLVKQVSASVLWEDSVRLIISRGISKFFEFGPGRVLKGLMRRIDNNAEVINIEKKEDILNLVSG